MIWTVLGGFAGLAGVSVLAYKFGANSERKAIAGNLVNEYIEDANAKIVVIKDVFTLKKYVPERQMKKLMFMQLQNEAIDANIVSVKDLGENRFEVSIEAVVRKACVID